MSSPQKTGERGLFASLPHATTTEDRLPRMHGNERLANRKQQLPRLRPLRWHPVYYGLVSREQDGRGKPGDQVIYRQYRQMSRFVPLPIPTQRTTSTVQGGQVCAKISTARRHDAGRRRERQMGRLPASRQSRAPSGTLVARLPRARCADIACSVALPPSTHAWERINFADRLSSRSLLG